MKQTTAPKSTPSPREVKTPSGETVGTNNPSSQFVGMALDMGWRLAVVVLVPVIGGFELDKVANTSPLLTIVGFALAMGGTTLIFWQTLQAANQPIRKEKKS